MPRKNKNKHFYLSLAGHGAILLALIVGMEFTAPLTVFENTNKKDVISAVVLGDTTKSKILPHESAAKPKPIKQIVKTEPKETPPPPAAKPVAAKAPPPKQDVIALKIEKKKAMQKKALTEKKLQAKLAQEFLADLKKVTEKQKKTQQKQLQSQFEKTLRDQAEKSLREQLLNEEIKLKGAQTRQAQGEINKYKALILQAISEHWVVPTQANKKLYCELMIRVAPGGDVLDVQVTKTSGDPSLDSSARAAVLKASPLPVPANAAAFDAFRQFVLKVKPENILSSDGGVGAV